MALTLLTLTGCSGGTKDPANRGPFKVSLITTGLGQIFPYRIRQADSFGNPTSTVLNIEDLSTLKNNVTANNSVLPVATFDPAATLPDGSPGNQFLFLKFSHKLDVTSVLSNLLANQTNSGLTTAVSLLAYDPNTEATSVIKGRGFVGGKTFYNVSGQLQLVQAVSLDKGNVVINDPRANGFPRGFSGDADLVQKNAFVFVPDVDGDLTTFETFPTNVLLRIIVSNAVRDTDNQVLTHEVCTATTVGPDNYNPNVLGVVSGGMIGVQPGNGAANVDPTTDILVRFNKPVQPMEIGTFYDPRNLVPASGGMTISITQATNTFPVLYYADPLGFGDFCNYTLKPAYNLLGNAKIDVSLNPVTVHGLNTLQVGQSVMTSFTTGTGPGLVNAPVAPEAIYIGIGGAQPGVSVIDCNGFGQGTGDINNTSWPKNPNIGAAVYPPLSLGTSNVDAGGAGVFTKTQDTNGETRLLREPLVGQIGDIQIGAPLDLVFNDENINVNTTRANQTNPGTFLSQSGNTISIAPHPNPPKLLFPPPNPASSIFGEEPTETSSTGPPASVLVAFPPCAQSPLNLLTIGNPFASTSTSVGIFGAFAPGVFYGPQPPPPSPPPPTPYCPFTSRQQIGHFLYVLDRDNHQILVVNSNRMTVLDTIKLTDPYSMAISPDLTTLAVTNFSSASVTFIDINPLSPRFHQVIAETRVDDGPTEVAYQPDGEDIFVLSTASNTVTILGGTDFSVRKVVSGFLNAPVDVAVTERYSVTGNTSNVYYAYILNANGTVAVYESGPSGVNGFGFDDIIGTVANVQFRRPRRIILAPGTQYGAVFIAHVDDTGLGQISKLELTSTPTAQQPVQQNNGGFILPPTFRQKEWTVTQKIGGLDATTPVKDLLSGNTPIDLALDNIVNNGAFPDQRSQLAASFSSMPPPPWGHSGKSTVKVATGGYSAATMPKFMFVALADVGKIDVIDLGTGKKMATIDAPGVTAVTDYWRQ